MKRLAYNLYKAFIIAFIYKNKVIFSGKEKKSIVKFLDQIKWLLKEHQYNNYYYLYGLNNKGNNQNLYFGKRQFTKLNQRVTRELNKRNGLTFGSAILTKDKFYATSILKSQSIPVVENLGLISGGTLILANDSIFSIDQVPKQFNTPFFIKNTLLEYNDGILYVEKIYEGNSYIVNGKKLCFEDIKNIINKGNWVIQKPEVSCHSIRKVNDSALNTTRIVTIIKEGQPEYIGGFQAFATHRKKTDCWGKGAIYVGFDPEKEKLYKYGYYHPDLNNKGIVEKHPDSNITFNNYKINGIKEAIRLCKNAHRYFYYTPIIGWDVAITDNGPKILEVNENPGMNALQAINSNIKMKLSL